METLLAAKKAQWREHGYPPGLIDKASRLALSATLGQLSHITRWAPTIDRAALLRYYLDVVADRWIKTFVSP